MTTRRFPLSSATINVPAFLERLEGFVTEPEEGFLWIKSALEQVRDMEPVDPLAVAVVDAAKRRRASVLSCTHRFRAKQKAAAPAEPNETL